VAFINQSILDHASFCLARSEDRQVLSERVMHFGVREAAAALSAAALIFFCSCEKHRLGEDPEVQKERVEEPKSGEENVSAPNKADVPESATPKPTPAEFFPENTPSP
jgi:hypothetical protein